MAPFERKEFLERYRELLENFKRTHKGFTASYDYVDNFSIISIEHESRQKPFGYYLKTVEPETYRIFEQGKLIILKQQGAVDVALVDKLLKLLYGYLKKSTA
jgi:hypothetical protein